jgi:hypothetical protein
MMMFVESPWPILVIGIIVEAALAVALLRTGQGRLLWAMLGVGAVVLLGLLVERLIVTDREAITNTLDAAAAAVEANNLDRLLETVSPSAQRTRTGARLVLGRFEFSKGRITDLEITVNGLTSPPSAKTKFRAIGKAHDRVGESPYEGFAVPVTVELHRENGRWLIGDFTAEGYTP